MFTTVLLYTIGYCVFMWALVICLLLFSNVLAGAHPAVFLHAPLLPFLFALDGWDEIRRKVRDRRVRGVSLFIVKELRKLDIVVQGKFGIRRRGLDPDDNCLLTACGSYYLYGGCEVFADVKDGQHKAYGDVYARAIKKFTWLTPKEICLGAYPKEPLHRAWATIHGFSEYYEKEYFVPCEDCGTTEVWHSLEWGDDASHQMRWGQEQSFSFRGGRKTRHVSGHICRSCSAKLGWSTSSGNSLCKS
jgi:hypothetical protein